MMFPRKGDSIIHEWWLTYRSSSCLALTLQNWPRPLARGGIVRCVLLNRPGDTSSYRMKLKIMCVTNEKHCQLKKEQSLAVEIVSDWSISTWFYTSTISTSQITQYELWYDYILVQIQNSSKWPWILPTLGSCTVDKKFNNLKSLTKSNKEPRKEWNLPIYLQLENFL